jgi:hypothetical protein
MLAGEELWWQLFSEPGAGSDLANLGTRAERDGDVYRVNGQKIWTSLADHAKFGILIARTRGGVSKHRGISYFIVAMDLPGIEVRPIRNMAGDAGFNEVFFTDARVPAENLIGDENLGWGMAKTTLANERVSHGRGRIARDERHPRSRVGPRLSLRSRAHRRRRNQRGAAQHHRRTPPRAPPRPRRRAGPHSGQRRAEGRHRRVTDRARH